MLRSAAMVLAVLPTFGLIQTALAVDEPVAPAAVPESADIPMSVTAPEPGKAARVGGDAVAMVKRTGDEFRSGDCRIDTPLPVGYPDPTPPGAIELKSYPSVRRAEVSGDMNPDLGMNMGFWPLFRHIQRRDIAMTSPVELDYHEPRKRSLDEVVAESEGKRWTMSFLYREPGNGELGEDGNVKIIDTAPVTVVSIGFRGSYSESNSQKQVGALRAWLETQTVWEAAGEPRMLYYNGPDVPGGRKWGEAQIPVQRVEPAATEGSGSSSTGGLPGQLPDSPATR